MLDRVLFQPPFQYQLISVCSHLVQKLLVMLWLIFHEIFCVFTTNKLFNPGTLATSSSSPWSSSPLSLTRCCLDSGLCSTFPFECEPASRQRSRRSADGVWLRTSWILRASDWWPQRGSAGGASWPHSISLNALPPSSPACWKGRSDKTILNLHSL